MNPRTCFLCVDRKPLYFDDYIKTNSNKEEFLVYRKITEKDRICKVIWNKNFKKWDIIKIWESEDIELACCHCQRFLNELINEGKPLWDLLSKFHDIRLDILKDLGILSRDQLLKLKNRK